MYKGDNMNIQWYPGHMTKAKREMIESMKLVDAVVEMLDARIPRSSRNPDIDTICGSKARIVVLNKSDLADQRVNKRWVNYYNSMGLKCIEVDSITGSGIKNIPAVLNEKFRDRNERLREKGIVSKPIRIMIAGVPNVGKSSLINKMAGKASMKTGDKPGVTKGRQWIKLAGGLELLDTPGILWPKFEDQQVGLHLAFTGAIRDEIMDTAELAIKLIESLKDVAPEALTGRYKVKSIDNEPVDLLSEIASNRGCILKGGIIDTERMSKIILDEFRGGKLGKISLEVP
jgi:ribosome biogenesis GTP-binding protein YlqF